MFFDLERYYTSLIITIDETKICCFVLIGFYKSKMPIFNDKPSIFVNIIILFLAFIKIIAISIVYNHFKHASTQF